MKESQSFWVVTHICREILIQPVAAERIKIQPTGWLKPELSVSSLNQSGVIGTFNPPLSHFSVTTRLPWWYSLRWRCDAKSLRPNKLWWLQNVTVCFNAVETSRWSVPHPHTYTVTSTSRSIIGSRPFRTLPRDRKQPYFSSVCSFCYLEFYLIIVRKQQWLITLDIYSATSHQGALSLLGTLNLTW